MSDKDEVPAFPTTAKNHNWGNGMTLRDYFAGQVLTSIVFGDIPDYKEKAKHCYAAAEAMLWAKQALTEKATEGKCISCGCSERKACQPYGCCWRGSLDAFEKRVKEIYKDNDHAKAYMAAGLV